MKCLARVIACHWRFWDLQVSDDANDEPAGGGAATATTAGWRVTVERDAETGDGLDRALLLGDTAAPTTAWAAYQTRPGRVLGPWPAVGG